MFVMVWTIRRCRCSLLTQDTVSVDTKQTRFQVEPRLLSFSLINSRLLRDASLCISFVWQLSRRIPPSGTEKAPKRAAALAHLCDLLLEGQRESGAAVGEGPRPVGHVLQPLDDKRGRHVEREIPDDVEVGWIFGIKHKSFFFFSHFPSFPTKSCRESLNNLTILPRLGDASWEASVHPVGEYVPVDDPQPSRCGLGEQL